MFRVHLCLCVAGKKLSDLERVTSLKVYNWFANRRKDLKRRANIGNIDLLFLSVCAAQFNNLCSCVKEKKLIRSSAPLV